MNNEIRFGYKDVLIYSSKEPIVFEPLFNNVYNRYPAQSNFTIDTHTKEIIDNKNNRYSLPMHLNDALNIKIGDYSIKLLLETIGNCYYIDSGTPYVNKKYTEFVEKNQTFIFPIKVLLHTFFNMNINDVSIPDDIIELIRTKKASIFFLFYLEGLFMHDNEIKWIEDFVDKFGFPKDGVYIISGNLNDDFIKSYEQKKGSEINFNHVGDIYFEHSFWFSRPHEKYLIDHRKYNYDIFHNILNKNRLLKKEKHFLCLSRRLRVQRLIMFAIFKTNENLDNKAYLSLGNPANTHRENILQQAEYLISGVKNIQIIRDYIYNLDYTKPFIIDDENLNTEVFTIGIKPNFDLYTTSFVNLVGETLIEKESIFFTEKLFKSIYCAQPFIILAGPNYLKKLKELGYRTFDKWWDESYDDEIEFSNRINKITSVLEYLSTKSIDELFEITREMEDTFIHNFNILMSLERSNKMLKFLSNFSNNVKITDKKTRRLI